MRVLWSDTQVIGAMDVPLSDGRTLRPVCVSGETILWQAENLMTVSARFDPDDALSVVVSHPRSHPTSRDVQQVIATIFADGTVVDHIERVAYDGSGSPRRKPQYAVVVRERKSGVYEQHAEDCQPGSRPAGRGREYTVVRSKTATADS